MNALDREYFTKVVPIAGAGRRRIGEAQNHGAGRQELHVPGVPKAGRAENRGHLIAGAFRKGIIE